MIRSWLDGNNQICDANGDPLAGGSVTFYVVGTTTKKAAYTSAAASTALPLTITLGSDGRPQTAAGAATEVWLSGDCDVVVLSSAGAVVRSYLNINPESISGASAELVNPSFESTLVGSWNIYQSDGTTVVATPDTDSVYHARVATTLHGAKGLKLIGAAIARSKWAGGGALIPHSPYEDIMVEFVTLASGATTPTKIIAEFYDIAGAVVGSALDIYSSASGNPTAAAALKAGRLTAAAILANSAATAYYSLKLLGGTAAGVDWVVFDGIRSGPAATKFGNADFDGTIAAVGLVTAKSGVSVGDASNSGKLVSYFPSAAVEIRERLVAAGYGGTGGVLTGSNGIISNSASGGTGICIITLSRNLVDKSAIKVTANSSGGNFAQVNHAAGSNAVAVYTYNALVSPAVLVNCNFSIEITEFG